MQRRLLGITLGSALLVVLGLTGPSSATADTGVIGGLFPGFDHIVVIYQENHSFDNLYGNWGRVGFDRVNGLSTADPTKTVQVAQDGTPLNCLYQNDVNLTSPSPLPTTCTDTAHPAKQGNPAIPQPVNSAFTNKPWRIDDFIPAALPPARPRLAPPMSATAPAHPGAAPRTWFTASTRSNTKLTAANRTATSPAATRSV